MKYEKPTTIQEIRHNAAQRRRKKRAMREWVSFFVTFGIALVCVLMVNRFLVINARIPSSSMENTIMIGDRILGNRLAYLNEDPKRYDIVIFRYPDDPSGKTLFIKRVIGLPGETVEIRDGKVYLNGGTEPLDDSFCPEPPVGSFGPYVVPDGEFFMLGDNRNYSKDSRYWEHTCVPKDQIIGRAFLRYWPIRDLGLIG